MLVLEVCLAVQVLSLDVGDAHRQGRSKDHHIAREELVFRNLDEAADFDVLALRVDEGACASWRALTRRLILLIVRLAALVILEAVLNHGNRSDENDRQDSRDGSRYVLQPRHTLQHSHDQEVGIRHLSQLLEQVLGEERGACVLRCLDSVRHEISVLLILSEDLINLKEAPFSQLGLSAVIIVILLGRVVDVEL